MLVVRAPVLAASDDASVAADELNEAHPPRLLVVARRPAQPRLYANAPRLRLIEAKQRVGTRVIRWPHGQAQVQARGGAAGPGPGSGSRSVHVAVGAARGSKVQPVPAPTSGSIPAVGECTEYTENVAKGRRPCVRRHCKQEWCVHTCVCARVCVWRGGTYADTVSASAISALPGVSTRVSHRKYAMSLACGTVTLPGPMPGMMPPPFGSFVCVGCANK